MIRRARTDDLPALMRIVAGVVAQMAEQGNDQWDEAYPLAEDLLRDVRAGTMWVVEDGDVLGFLVVDDVAPEAYASVRWSAAESLVVHRVAVDAAARGRGVASRLERHAEACAREAGVTWLRVDTHSSNTGMRAFLTACGYRLVGPFEMNGKDRPFVAYERALAR